MTNRDPKLERLPCTICSKLIPLDEEDWWGHVVFCKECGEEVMLDYKEYLKNNPLEDLDDDFKMQ